VETEQDSPRAEPEGTPSELIRKSRKTQTPLAHNSSGPHAFIASTRLETTLNGEEVGDVAKGVRGP
jgi:hypothetical protein